MDVRFRPEADIYLGRLDFRTADTGGIASLVREPQFPITSGSAGDYERVSGLQIPFLEFLRRRTERAELVDRRTHGREGECIKRFGEHLVEVIPVERRQCSRADLTARRFA